MEELRAAFLYEPNLTHVKDLVESVADLVAFGIASLRTKRSRGTMLEILPLLGFNYELLYTVCNEYVYNSKSVYYPLKGIDPACKAAMSRRLEDLSNKQGNRNALQAFEFITAELVSSQGMTFPKSPGSYYQVWVEAKKGIPAKVETMALIMHTELPDGTFELDCDDLPQYTKNNIGQILELIRKSAPDPTT
jgi:hypothetical protein